MPKNMCNTCSPPPFAAAMSRLFTPLAVAFLLLMVSAGFPAPAEPLNSYGISSDRIIPGAWQTEKYLPLLEGKRVAVAVNHTSMVGNRHLADTLLLSGVNVVKAFSPEHGFRGEAADGELVDDEYDETTRLPVISLYGTGQRRPSATHLSDIDIIVFDIQDVGARFYTYVSTMTYIMQEAASQGIPVMILDRPNPNGHYIDGPVLELEYASFIGLHPVPVVHGMTMAEYAQMVNGEGWLGLGRVCELVIIKVENYTRQTPYCLPLPPSPNLPNMHSVYLYPSLCLFEGTQISVGRGTPKPFQVFGHPEFPPELFTFTFMPESQPASKYPPLEGQTCYGKDLSIHSLDSLRAGNRINLAYLLEAYRHFPDKAAFFSDRAFDLRAGNSLLRNQIRAGLSEEHIRMSWQEGLDAFRKFREPYLLYPDLD